MSFFYGKFKAVIFDLDGVIVDSEPIHMEVMNSVCSRWGRPHTQSEYEKYIGKTDVKIWTEIKSRYQADFDLKKMIRYYNGQLTKYYRDAADLPIVKGIPELLDILKDESIPCAIGSASSAVNIDITLAHLKNRDIFSAIVSGDEIKHGKPSPDIFLTAAKKLNLKPDDCAVIEDTEVGIAAAKNAGMFCVAYANPTSGKQDLSKADKIIHKIEELF